MNTILKDIINNPLKNIEYNTHILRTYQAYQDEINTPEREEIFKKYSDIMKVQYNIL